jgi:hypothetical protein
MKNFNLLGDTMSDLLGRFFSEVREDQTTISTSVHDASAQEQKKTPIEHSGNYLCEVSTFAFLDENKLRCFPELFIAEKTGSLNLTLNLRVVDGTKMVPKGASIYKNVTLCPGKPKDGHISKESVDKVMRFTKPILAAVTGNENIDITSEWISEWLLPEFTKTGESIKLVRDHKMKEKVMVLVDEEQGRDSQIRLVAKSISRAVPGDKSETFEKPSTTQAPNMSIPAGANTTAPSFSHVSEKGDAGVGIGVDKSDVPVIPETEEF